MTTTRDERGSGLVEMAWLGLVLVLPLLWVVLSVFEVQRGSFGVSAAARAAARAYALAPDDRSGRRRAEAVARQALADQGVGDAPLRVRVTCTPYPGDCHRATSVITVRIDSAVTLPLLPDVLGAGTPTFRLRAAETVPIGRYRGSATPLVLAFAAIVLLFVAVVVDAGAAYLTRQRLDALADGAALQGADLGAQGAEAYAGGLASGSLAVSRAEAERAVRAYLHDTGATRAHRGLRATVTVRGDRVVVVLTARPALPLHVPGVPAPTVRAVGSAVVDPDQ